jgi:hypothetical protein
MNPFPSGNAERIWASQVQTDVATATETTLIFQAAQPLWADLSRLCLQAFSFTEPAADGTSPTMNDLSQMVKISSIKIRGAYDLIRGANTPVTPMSAFSPYRGYNPYRLNAGTWARFQAGERIEVTFTGPATFKASVSGGLPVVLSCDVGLQAVPGAVKAASGSAIIGCPAVSTAYGGGRDAANTLTFSFDEAGIMDVANTVINLFDDDTSATKAQNQPLAVGPSSYITQITLVDSSEVIVGNAGSGSLGIPAGMFGSPGAPLDRENPWALIQMQQGSAGSSVIFKTTSYSATGAKADGFAGAPFYPSGANKPGGVC